MKIFRGIMCESCPYYRKEVYYYKNIDPYTGEVYPSSYVSHYSFLTGETCIEKERNDRQHKKCIRNENKNKYSRGKP